MSERREWKASDADEVRVLCPDETGRDDEAEAVAKHFGYEVRNGIPEGGHYWALEPRCVLGLWYRRAGEENWSCLRCMGVYAFESQMRDDWMRRFKAGEFAKLRPRDVPGYDVAVTQCGKCGWYPNLNVPHECRAQGER